MKDNRMTITMLRLRELIGKYELQVMQEYGNALQVKGKSMQIDTMIDNKEYSNITIVRKYFNNRSNAEETVLLMYIS